MIHDLLEVAEQPSVVTYSVALDSNEKIVLRPLEPGDVEALAAFLAGLSPETRRLSTFDGYDLAAAKALCEAIGKYDKLRFVVESDSDAKPSKRIVGLVEFSFGLPAGDVERYRNYGYELDEKTDCRFGPTFADDYQGKGLGSKLFPFVRDIAAKFGKQRIILWGGVLEDNERAIRYYEKHGFQKAGKFTHEGLGKMDMLVEI